MSIEQSLTTSQQVAILARLVTSESAARQRQFRAPLFSDEMRSANDQLAQAREQIADALRHMAHTGALTEIERLLKASEATARRRVGKASA